jgi:HEAT repeat protein
MSNSLSQPFLSRSQSENQGLTPTTVTQTTVTQTTVTPTTATQTAAQQYLQQLLGLCGGEVVAATDDLTQDDADRILNLALDLLAAGDFQTRWEVAKLLPQVVKARVINAQTAIAPLLTLLQDEDTEEELSWFVIRILGQLDDPEVLPIIVETLKTSASQELQAMAAEVLTHWGNAAIASLTQLLTVAEWRLLAVQSLSRIRHSDTIAPLLEVVQDADPVIRAAAIEALSSFHDPQISPVLLNALHDPAAIVRREAVIGLGFCTDQAGDLKLVQHLQDRLWDFDLEVCRQAAIALGRCGAEAAVLFEVLDYPSTPQPIQLEAIRALGWLNTAAALDYLRQWLLSNPPLTIAQEIVTVFGRISSPVLKPQAAQLLIEVLARDASLDRQTPRLQLSPELKQTIALSLGYLNQPIAVEPLIALLASESGVRLHAIAALKQIDPNAHQKLMALSGESLPGESLPGESLSADLKQGIAIALAEW